MPERTNDYQKLVMWVHQALAAPSATITESAMVKAPGFGDLREIDVLMETDAAPFRIKIAIEAKNHKNKLDATQIEAVIGKYRAGAALVVDKVVVVCPNGYSRTAATKARANGISLLTLSEAEGVDWSQFLPENMRNVPTQLNFEIKPHVTNVQLRAASVGGRPPTRVQAGRILCKCHGNDYGTPQSFATRVMQTLLTRESSFQHQFEEKLKTDQTVCASIAWPMGRFKLIQDGAEIPLLELRFKIQTTQAPGALTLKTLKFEGDSVDEKFVQHAYTEVAGKRIDFVMPDGFKSKRIVVNVADARPTAKSKAKKGNPR